MCLSKFNFQIVGCGQWLFTLTTCFWWRTCPRVTVFTRVTFNWKFRSNLCSFTFHNVDPSELCGMRQHSRIPLFYSSLDKNLPHIFAFSSHLKFGLITHWLSFVHSPKISNGTVHQALWYLWQKSSCISCKRILNSCLFRVAWLWPNKA